MEEGIQQTIKMIQDGMDLSLARRRLIASNVANAETPGYKGVDVDFERYFKANHGPVQSLGPVRMVRTDSRHLKPVVSAPILPLRWSVSSVGKMRADGNTVDMEQELAKLAQNQIRFQALTETLNRVFALLQDAVTEGGKR